MKYNAFISYKHSPLDMEIAKKVHTGLETFQVPRATQKKVGKKKISRVFRDQEELPIGSDLTGEITAALAESEYLIVVCSPRTPQSPWVIKEIETFISMHGRDKVLAILIEGEPHESFPRQLTTDAYGNSVEPLAADIRGAGRKERNDKLKTEILRLAAPILGCTYDDLRQRHHERKVRKVITYVALIATLISLLGIFFGVYNREIANNMTALANEKTVLANEKAALADEINRRYQENMLLQAKALAGTSTELFEYGDRRAAVLVAKEALPSDTTDTPYVPKAEYALATALYAYTVNGNIESDFMYYTKASIKSVTGDSDDRFITVTDIVSNVYVFDARSYNIMLEVGPVFVDDTVDSVVTAAIYNDVLIVLAQKNIYVYEMDGTLIKTVEHDISASNAAFFEDAGYAVLTSYDEFGIVSLRDLSIDVVEADDGYFFISNEYDMSAEYGFFAISEYDSYGYSKARLVIYDINKKKFSTVELADDYVLDVHITDLGNIVTVDYGNLFVKVSEFSAIVQTFTRNGQLIFEKPVMMPLYHMLEYGVSIKSRYFEEEGRGEIVLAVDSQILVMDEFTGEISSTINTSSVIRTVMLKMNSEIVLVFTNTGDLNIYDAGAVTGGNQGQINLCTVISGAKIIDQKYIIYFGNELFIFTDHTSSSATNFIENDDDRTIDHMITARNGNYYMIEFGDEPGVLHFYDKRGIPVSSYDLNDIYITDIGTFTETNEYVVFSDGRLIYINPEDGTAEIDNLGDEGSVTTHAGDAYACSYDGAYSVLIHNNSYMVFENITHSMIYEGNIDSVIYWNGCVTSNGKYLFCISTNGVITKVDLENRTSSRIGLDKDKYDDIYADKVVVSRDNNYYAITYRNGLVGIFNVETDEEIYVTELKNGRAITAVFTPNSKILVCQDTVEDLTVIDIDNLSLMMTSLSLTFDMKSIDGNADDSVIAVIGAYGAEGYYVDAATFEPLGKVKSVCGYNILEKTFFVKNNVLTGVNSNGKYTYRYYITKVPYLNYQQLLEEAEKQFPGDELTDYERYLYNIE